MIAKPFNHPSGKSRPFLDRPPQGTGRANFFASGSITSKAPLDQRTRLLHASNKNAWEDFVILRRSFLPVFTGPGRTRHQGVPLHFRARKDSIFSLDEATRGSWHGFPWDDVALRRNPYPSRYRKALAFSTIPYPPGYRLSLRIAFPECYIPGPGWAYLVACR